MKKLYYSIREVSDKTAIEPHVLRFWEKKFSQLRPKRGKSGNRFYRERDIQVVLAIKELRQEQKFTIKGAVERLREDPDLWKSKSLDGAEISPAAPPSKGPERDLEVLSELRALLLELKGLVAG